MVMWRQCVSHVAPWVQLRHSATSPSSGLLSMRGLIREQPGCVVQIPGYALSALGHPARDVSPVRHQNTLYMPNASKRSPCSCSSEPSGQRNSTRLCPSTVDGSCATLNRLQVSGGCPSTWGDRGSKARQAQPGWPPRNGKPALRMFLLTDQGEPRRRFPFNEAQQALRTSASRPRCISTTRLAQAGA